MCQTIPNQKEKNLFIFFSFEIILHSTAKNVYFTIVQIKKVFILLEI